MRRKIQYHHSLDREINYSTGATTDAKTTGEPVPIRGVRAIELLAFFSRHKETQAKTGSGVVYLAPGIFSPDAPRQIAYAQGADIMLFDFDGPTGDGDDNRWIAGKLAELRRMGVAHACATSYSHGRKSAPGHSRWRIILVADRRILPEEYKACWLHWASFFEARPDKSQDHLASVFYPPTCPPSESRKWTRLHTLGSAFSVDEAFASGSKMRKDDLYPSASTKPNRETVARAREALRAAPGERPAPITGDGDLPADTVLHTPSGSFPARSLRPGERVRDIHAIWRRSLSGNPSVTATCHDNGRVYLYDWGDCTGRWVAGWVDSYLSGPPFCLRKEESKGGPESGYFRSGNIITCVADTVKYLGDQLPPQKELQPNGGYMFLDAGLGVGKSVYLRSTADAVDTVTVINDSVSLSRALARDFRAELYSEVKGETLPPRLVSTINTLPKFSLFESSKSGRLELHTPIAKRDLCIVDEAPAVRAALHNGTKKVAGTQQTKEALFDYLLAHKWGQLASADFTPEEIQWYIDGIKARDPEADIIIVRRAPVEGERSIDWFSSSAWEANLLEAIRAYEIGTTAPIVVPTTEIEYHLKLRKIVEEIRPDLAFWGVSSVNSKDPAIRAALCEPNEILRNHHVICFSPSIKNGLSWTAPVSQVFCRFTADLPARDLGQMLMRVRNPLDTTIKMAFSERHGEYECDPDYIAKIFLGLAERSAKRVDGTMMEYRTDYRTGKRVATDPELLASAVLTERERRLNANDSIREMLRCFHRHGWTVTDRRDEEATEEAREEVSALKSAAKEAVKSEYVEAILAAPALAEDDAQALADSPEMTRDEQHALVRHQIEDYYDRPVTAELVEADAKGRKRKEVRDWTLLRFYQAGIKAPAILADRHATDAVEYKHVALRIGMLDELLRAAIGCPLDQAQGLSLTAAQLVERVGPMLADPLYRTKAREILRCSVTEHTAEQPAQWVLARLRSLGVEVTATRPRDEQGNRVRTYTIDLTQIRDLAKAEHSRMLRLLADMRGATSRYAPDCDYMLTDDQQQQILFTLAA